MMQALFDVNGSVHRGFSTYAYIWFGVLSCNCFCFCFLGRLSILPVWILSLNLIIDLDANIHYVPYRSSLAERSWLSPQFADRCELMYAFTRTIED